MYRLAIACTLVACSKSNDGATPAPSASSVPPVVSVGAAGSSAPVGPADGGATVKAAAAAAYTGTYALAARAYYVSESKDWSMVKQVKDDPTKHVGDGTFTLAVADDGKVSGTVEGPAGPAVIDGRVVEGEIRANVRRKDPTDDGLTGTLTASPKDGTGKLSLAESNAAIVREGKITLKKN